MASRQQIIGIQRRSILRVLWVIQSLMRMMMKLMMVMMILEVILVERVSWKIKMTVPQL